jgi:hypothetical protein
VVVLKDGLVAGTFGRERFCDAGELAAVYQTMAR